MWKRHRPRRPARHYQICAQCSAIFAERPIRLHGITDPCPGCGSKDHDSGIRYANLAEARNAVLAIHTLIRPIDTPRGDDDA